MSAGEVIGTYDRIELPWQRIEVLDEPYVTIAPDDPAVTLRVLAHVVDKDDESRHGPIGFVSTKAGRATLLGEFSGKPTGKYMPCNAVKGFVGEGIVYSKNVSTDTPLSGLRTAIAQRRAARAVRSRLKI